MQSTVGPDQLDGPPGSYDATQTRNPMVNWRETGPNTYKNSIKPLIDSSHRILTITVYNRCKPRQCPWTSAPERQVKLSCEITMALESMLSISCIFLESKLLGPKVCRLLYTLLEPGEPRLNRRNHVVFREIERTTPCELVFDLLPVEPPINPHTLQVPRPRFKLAVFDMDSTLVDQEVIDELARSIGLTKAVSAITARAMNGEIDFEESLKERVALLKGVRADIWDALQTNGSITIAKGAIELISRLRDMGVITAVVSGGFLPMADWLKMQLGLNYASANHLLTSPPSKEYPYEHLNGLLDPEKQIVHAQQKEQLLRCLARAHGIGLEQTLAVGDGSNDLLMMGTAALGVAWKAKASVQEKAPARLNGDSLEELLYLFG